jgi:hypothetical protein
MRWLWVVFALGCSESAPPAGCTSPDFDGAPLGVHCNALRDRAGRTVLLHGVNAHFKGIVEYRLDDGTLTSTDAPALQPDDCAQMRAMGMNAMRLPINWSALEPTADGGFDETVMDRIALVVDQCRAAGVWVLLDMHQDGYSKYVGTDGAPGWAVVPPVTSRPTDASSNISGAALAAFGTFFGDNGESLRQRFAAVLMHLAQRFGNDDAVLGFELFNEPLGASDYQLVKFDREMIAALRPMVPHKLIFFEPPAIRNVIDSANPGTASVADGTVYAPHVYTAVFAQVPRPLIKDYLAPSEESARVEADGYRAPLVITEFGFGPTDPEFPNYARWQGELQDAQRASAFFWIWKDHSSPGSWGFFEVDPVTDVAAERTAAIEAFSRVRLEAAAGALVSVRFDADAHVFETTFDGDDAVRAPNLVSIGRTPGFASWQAFCDGKPVSPAVAEPLAIACNGAGRHTVRLEAR